MAKNCKFMRTIAIYAKITRFFNNGKLCGNLRYRVIASIKLEGVIVTKIIASRISGGSAGRGYPVQALVTPPPPPH